jgi:hypothetical protein
MIDQVKIIRELGHGMIGTVYLVEYKGKQYALKIEHVLKSDIQESNSPIWNEIHFAIDVANPNPNHFMKLYDFDFVNSCNLKQEYPMDLEVLPKQKQKYLISLASSPYCIRKLYSLVDSTLDQVKFNSLQERYSFIIQLLYILYLMEQKGYVHGDFHSGNIGVIQTNKKYINILGHRIPTFGKLFQAIDYGSVLNKNTLDPKKRVMGLPETQKDIYDWASIEDKLRLMTRFVNNNSFWNYVEKNNISIPMYMDQMDLVLKSKENELLSEFVDDPTLKLELYKILFPESFQKLLLDKQYKKYYPVKYEIPLEDLLYFMINFQDTRLLLDYFISKASLLDKHL